ncbi:uncharacterized protein METZ01_LOCUS307295, partial [marine metagenome]
MRQFSAVLLTLLLASACGGGSDLSTPEPADRLTTTSGLGGDESTTESTSTSITTTSGLGGDESTTESTSTSITTTSGLGGDESTTESTSTSVATDDDYSDPRDVATSGFDIHSRFACIIKALGNQAAFEMLGRPATSEELTKTEHCPPSTHDLSCVDKALGVEITDLLLAGRYEPSVEEVTQVAGCVLGGTSDQDVAAAGETAAAGGTTTDAPPIDPAAALVDGELVAVEPPTPGYEPPDEGGCSVYEGDRCAELRWEPV